MANNLRLLLTTNKNTLVAFAAQPNGPTAWFYRKLETLIGQLGLGAFNSSIVVVPNLVAATGTVTFSSFAAADTVTINGAVFTASASPSGANQFLVTGGDTLAAAALTAKINSATAPANVLGCVTATSSGAVITLTCVVPGLIGNTQTLAISAHGSVSAARMASGTEGTTATYHHGL